MASSYVRPTSLDEALTSLSAAHAGAPARRPVILAGGTDYYPARVGRALDDDILDITAIPDLCRLMKQQAELARAENRAPANPQFATI